jgi:hypothetical protein
MSDDFLSRWSRRKIEARKGEVVPQKDVIPAKAGTETTPENPSPAPVPPEPLPPLESLTPESDFSPFMKSEVDPKVRRDALKTLFQDPRHNVMDGLDVYIDDYSQPDPLPEGWLEKLNVMAYLGDQPAMRKEAEEKAAKAAELELKQQEEQRLAAAAEPLPDGASQSPAPSPESQDYPPQRAE